MQLTTSALIMLRVFSFSNKKPGKMENIKRENYSISIWIILLHHHKIKSGTGGRVELFGFLSSAQIVPFEICGKLFRVTV